MSAASTASPAWRPCAGFACSAAIEVDRLCAHCAEKRVRIGNTLWIEVTDDDIAWYEATRIALATAVQS